MLLIRSARIVSKWRQCLKFERTYVLLYKIEFSIVHDQEVSFAVSSQATHQYDIQFYLLQQVQGVPSLWTQSLKHMAESASLHAFLRLLLFRILQLRPRDNTGQ
jgi:hypothetical protein